MLDLLFILTNDLWPSCVQNMSGDQSDSVVLSLESLLNHAKLMQTQCRDSSEQLSVATAQLRLDCAGLQQQCQAAQLDMAHIRRQLDELMDTKAAIEAKERQARKLSRQLWG